MRTAVILFGVALGIVVAVATVTTFDRPHTRKASNAPTWTTGLARRHEPLDSAPGKALPAYAAHSPNGAVPSAAVR